MVFAITWAALPVAYFAFNDRYETGSYLTAAVAMFAAGTVASMVCFEFDWIIGAVQYGLYLGVGLLGRWLAGLGALPVTPTKNIPSTTDPVEPTAWIGEAAIVAFDSVGALILRLGELCLI